MAELKERSLGAHAVVGVRVSRALAKRLAPLLIPVTTTIVRPLRLRVGNGWPIPLLRAFTVILPLLMWPGVVSLPPPQITASQLLLDYPLPRVRVARVALFLVFGRRGPRVKLQESHHDNHRVAADYPTAM